eukprot:IDg3719t1
MPGPIMIWHHNMAPLQTVVATLRTITRTLPEHHFPIYLHQDILENFQGYSDLSYSKDDKDTRLLGWYCHYCYIFLARSSLRPYLPRFSLLVVCVLRSHALLVALPPLQPRPTAVLHYAFVVLRVIAFRCRPPNWKRYSLRWVLDPGSCCGGTAGSVNCAAFARSGAAGWMIGTWADVLVDCRLLGTMQAFDTLAGVGVSIQFAL